MPLGRFCSFMWWYCTRNASQQDIDKFRTRLWQPVQGEVIPANSPWSAENETKAFQALKAQTGA